MKTAKRGIVTQTHSRGSAPQITVLPGEEFLAETELCTGPWLNSPEDFWSPEKTSMANPTVCVAVEGARPGDMLAVHILGITPGLLGYTGFDASSNPIARRIAGRELPYTVKTVEIRDGYVLWSNLLRIPVKPMIGTLGTAPAGDAAGNIYGGRHGGNMDVQEAAPGSIVYLPVHVPGALLHIGDAHAVQGDGEINCAGGVECRAVVRLQADVLPRPAGMEWPRIENGEYIMAVACCATAEESFCAAARELHGWMTAGFGFTDSEAYLLMGQVIEARCTQFVNPVRSYICKLPKRYLVPCSP